MFSFNSELKFNLALENCTNNIYCKFHIVVALHHIINNVDFLTYYYLSPHNEINYQLDLPNNGIVYFQWYSPSTCCSWSINNVILYINDTIIANLPLEETYFSHGRIKGLQSDRYYLAGHNSVLLTNCSVMTIDATSSGVTSFTSTVITPSSSSITSITSSFITNSVTYTSHLIIIPTETFTISNDKTTIKSMKTSLTSKLSTETSITSMRSTNIISTPSPTPITCSTDGIWPETLPGHNVTGFYCYKGTVNGK